MDTKKSGGSMHKAESILTTLYYGFNKDKLFLRLDPAIPFSELADDTTFCINLIKPGPVKIVVSVKPSLKAEVFKKSEGEWLKIKDIIEVAAQDILELGISFRDLDAREKEEINFFVFVLLNGEETERHPWRGYISVTVPTPDFEAFLWY
jgi:hypothetical protein